ncbi:hypothetical protein IEQ34_006952 [Dendrobium chrysotoxum]|uniref:Beta-catenin-like protein 1 N-terminal domain-containing protein n=1 Tax=Dendrobium chrysotoxum TaxID=161865 RepID=A0AAV7H6I9_DENCH|nr:hypothetical protein IEQ34_006952 [Dendrobium chrysotoxum]
MIENNALELLVQNISRLSESDSDETAAIYNALATVENTIEVKPAVAELVCERTKLLRWLLGRIKIREFDGNEQYARFRDSWPFCCRTALQTRRG